MSKGDGKRIGIKFTQRLINDFQPGLEKAFTVEGQERKHVNGPLIDGEYVVKKVERKEPIIQDILDSEESWGQGDFIDIEIKENKIQLARTQESGVDEGPDLVNSTYFSGGGVKPYGEYIYVKEMNIISAISTKITWQQEIPEGTNITVSTAMADTNGMPMIWIEQPYEEEEIQSICLDENLQNKKLFIKIQLETNDIEKTPSLSNLYYAIQDTQYIRITMDDLGRFNNVEGELTVKYDHLIGNLAGESGSVKEFETTFVPTDLVPVPNPYVEEGKIVATAAIDLDFIRVGYINAIHQESIFITANISVDLIHVDLINP